MEPMVHLGCINGTYINDLVTSSLTIPGNTITYWINQLLSQQFAQQNDPSFNLNNPGISIIATDHEFNTQKSEEEGEIIKNLYKD